MRPRYYALAALVLLSFTIVGAMILLPRMQTDQTPARLPTASAEPDCRAEINGYCYGFSTYYVATRREVPRNWGNARTWYANAQRDGYKVGSIPAKGAIAWSDTGPWGDVAYVEDVSVDGGWVTVSSMNYAGNWNKVITRTVPVGAFMRYIY